MGKVMRVLIVIAGLAIIVVLGMQGVAWAEKLGIGGPAPAAGASVQGLPVIGAPQAVEPAAARPMGTVITVPTVVDIVPGSLVIVGNCATAFTVSIPEGITFTATVVDPTELPANLPGALLSCGIRVDAKPVSTTLGAEIELCFPIPPTKTALAYDHDVEQWVKTAEAVSNGQSCVKLAVDNPNPTFAALFQQ